MEKKSEQERHVTVKTLHHRELTKKAQKAAPNSLCHTTLCLLVGQYHKTVWAESQRPTLDGDNEEDPRQEVDGCARGERTHEPETTPTHGTAGLSPYSSLPFPPSKQAGRQAGKHARTHTQQRTHHHHLVHSRGAPTIQICSSVHILLCATYYVLSINSSHSEIDWFCYPRFVEIHHR